MLPAALQERARARMVIQMTDAYVFARPLSDPLGGTTANNGRHPSKMREFEPPEGALRVWLFPLPKPALLYPDAYAPEQVVRQPG